MSHEDGLQSWIHAMSLWQLFFKILASCLLVKPLHTTSSLMYSISICCSPALGHERLVLIHATYSMPDEVMLYQLSMRLFFFSNLTLLFLEDVCTRMIDINDHWSGTWWVKLLMRFKKPDVKQVILVSCCFELITLGCYASMAVHLGKKSGNIYFGA